MVGGGDAGGGVGGARVIDIDEDTHKDNLR